MQTFKRICKEDFTVVDISGEPRFTLKAGQEYLVSFEDDGYVAVFDRYWFKVPAGHFHEGVEFTKG